MFTIWTGLLAIIALIITVPIIPFLYIFKDKYPEQTSHIANIIARWGMKIVILLSFFKVEVEGIENIPDEPVLFVSNHRSDLDILLDYGFIPADFAFVAKKEIYCLPLIRRWMIVLQNIFLDRKSKAAGINMIKNAIKLIQNGKSVFIYPEGTRSKNKGRIGMGMMHNGSFKIAEKSDCLIVPIANWGTRETFENRHFWIKPGKWHLAIGKPLRLSDVPNDVENVGDYFGEIILKMMIEIDEKEGFSEAGRYE